MIYQVKLAESADATITHLPPPIKQQITEAIRFLMITPMAGEPLKRELQGKWKFRVGGHRIIYELEPQHKIIHVIAIGPRRTIYEELMRTGRF